MRLPPGWFARARLPLGARSPSCAQTPIAPKRSRISEEDQRRGTAHFVVKTCKRSWGCAVPGEGCGTVPSTGRRRMPFMRAGKLKLEILNDPSEGRSRFIPYPEPHDNKQNLVRYRRSCLRADSLGALARSTARVNDSGTCHKMSPRCDSGSIVAARFKRGLIWSLVRR